MREMHQLAVELGIADQVVRPAYRSDPEVFYRAMDAFCQSSRYEGLPFTGLEALAANLPLILTDAPGLQSFGDSGYGLSHVFYGKADEQSLATAMEENSIYFLQEFILKYNEAEKAQENTKCKYGIEEICKPSTIKANSRKCIPWKDKACDKDRK